MGWVLLFSSANIQKACTGWWSVDWKGEMKWNKDPSSSRLSNFHSVSIQPANEKKNIYI